MSFLNKQIHFTSSLKGKFLVGLILGTFLSFVIIFLEPFDTNQFESKNRFLLLTGFGIVFFGAYFILSVMENAYYHKVNKSWLTFYEIISIVIIFSVSGTFIFLYNHLIVNDEVYSLEMHLRYYKSIVIFMIPIFAPLAIYLRQKFGELIVPVSLDTFIISGENKNELLELQKSEILYIQAVENYIEICFVDAREKLVSKTFRQTLTNVHQQLPFLEKCHRSYLVNLNNVSGITGNSQSAKISFRNFDKEIPLSKSLYKELKTKVLERLNQDHQNFPIH